MTAPAVRTPIALGTGTPTTRAPVDTSIGTPVDAANVDRLQLPENQPPEFRILDTTPAPIPRAPAPPSIEEHEATHAETTDAAPWLAVAAVAALAWFAWPRRRRRQRR